ncbi:SGNH/GDSL hydrolase family protein [Luethyella okanaganae]|uniref:SGNH/GDSL hydrolase family protein n=1 Tax=Luethyella okanaganae TaxID=69372 RepID=A0ABW1VC46_9MICO
MSVTVWKRFVAVGDSISEGLCDPAPTTLGTTPGPEWLGWADRLAVILDGSAHLSGREIEFANLAVRGRRIEHVVTDQIPAAIRLGADLVSVMVGGNDLMSAKADPDKLAAHLEDGIVKLRESGADVLLANCFDPQFAFFLKPLRGRAAVFNANIWSIARAHGATVLDLWGIEEFRQTSMWAADRVHLSAEGHRLLASRAAHSLGVPYAEVAARSLPPVSSLAVDRDTHTVAQWFRRYALPWIVRRVRRVSTGDGISPKLPHPASVRAHH